VPFAVVPNACGTFAVYKTTQPRMAVLHDSGDIT
jgi:hypothetical protein